MNGVKISRDQFMNLIQTKSFQLAVYIKGNKDSSKLALVLPGRLDTKDYPHMRSHVEYLAKRGYLALSFDPPGTWESPGDISLYTMTSYLKSINELIEYFGNRPTFVVGHSRGGSMAVLSAIENEHVTHFVSAMGSYSYAPESYRRLPGEESWQSDGYKVEKRDVPGSISNEIKIFNLPYAFYEDSAQYDMLEGLRHCAKPKLFIYGKRDVLVSPEVAKTAFREAASPKELHEVDSDHDYRFNADVINEVNSLIGSFLGN